MRLIALLLLLATVPAHAVVVSGTITRLADGQPAAGAQVTLVQQVTPFMEQQLGQVSVGATGAYAFSFPNTGVFYIRVTLAPLLPSEVVFNFGSGSPPQVVDVALSSPSTIVAVVRDASTQAALVNVYVAFYRLPNLSPTTAITDALGRATLANASGGDYRICVRNLTDAYIDECQDGQQLSLNGALSGVATSAIGSGVNVEVPIALDIGAAISGRISDRYFGGAAAGSIQFRFYDAAGATLDSTTRTLGPDGAYELAGLPAGTYRLAAYGFGTNYYTPRVHPNVDCDPGCDATLGTAITVAGVQQVANIDFALHPGGVVAGTVRDATSLAPIAGATVRVYRDLVFPPGWTELGRAQTAADGSYRIARISYRQLRVAASASGYFARAWPGFACYSEPCSAGDTIQSAIDQVITGVDHPLTSGGTIAGSVVAATTGGQLSADVLVSRSDGSLTFSANTPNGVFETYGLPPGTYYAAASRFRNGSRDCDLYQAQVCATGNPIDPAVATPIVVGTSAVQGIQFVLPNDDLLVNGFE